MGLVACHPWILEDKHNQDSCQAGCKQGQAAESNLPTRQSHGTVTTAMSERLHGPACLHTFAALCLPGPRRKIMPKVFTFWHDPIRPPCTPSTIDARSYGMQAACEALGIEYASAAVIAQAQQVGWAPPSALQP